jgi:hypothetical protein
MDAKALARWEHDTHQWAIDTGRDLALDLYYDRDRAACPHGVGVVQVLPDSLDDRVSAVGRDRVGGARPNDQSRLCGGASGAVKPASRAGGRCS